MQQSITDIEGIEHSSRISNKYFAVFTRHVKVDLRNVRNTGEDENTNKYDDAGSKDPVVIQEGVLGEI